MNLHNYIITPAVCIRFEQMVDKHVESARSSEFKTEYRVAHALINGAFKAAHALKM